jgi:Ca-activated chloride channel homolog
MIRQIFVATALLTLCSLRFGLSPLPITPITATPAHSSIFSRSNFPTNDLATTQNPSPATNDNNKNSNKNPNNSSNNSSNKNPNNNSNKNINNNTSNTNNNTDKPADQVNIEDTEEAVIKVTTVNIGLPITVYDDKGRFVPNLKRENFQVLENNVVQPIISFHAQANLPLSVAVVMDTSTSVRNRLEFEKVAIKQFLTEVLRSERDRLAFMTFDSEIKLREDFTNDVAKVGAAVDEIKVIGGQTSLYDAIYKICRENMARTSARRRVVVAVSDGADTNSRHTLSQAIEAAQRTETTIYAISTKGGATFRVEGTEFLNVDDRDLRKLCRDTGGEVFFPDDAEKLKRAFQLVADFLRNQYLIIYEPLGNADGKFHKIEVRIVGRKNLLTISRSGYTAN